MAYRIWTEGTTKASPACLTGMQKTILVAGGTGLIGQQLVQDLLASKHLVKVLSRSAKSSTDALLEYVQWDPTTRALDPSALRNVDVIFHLAGAPVAQRWTPGAKASIMDSRKQTSATLCAAIEALPESERPRVCIAASAIGIYPSGPDWLDESSDHDRGFLAEVVKAWETGVVHMENLGLRTVSLRIGLVLDPAGGMLGKLLPVFKWGLGSAVGSGQQWQSWVHTVDVRRAFVWAMETSDARGIYNLTAPEPVTNEELSEAIARACRRPFWAPRVPAFALKMVYGEMAEVVLASQRVRSKRLQTTGFEFQFNTVHAALADLI